MSLLSIVWIWVAFGNIHAQPLQIPVRPPLYTPADELVAILVHAPAARVIRATGYTNVTHFLNADSRWSTDDGNVYFAEFSNWPRPGWRVRSLFDGPHVYQTSRFLPADLAQVGLSPDGTMILMRGNRLVAYNPKGRLMRYMELPISGIPDGFHAVGNGDVLVWWRNSMLYIQDMRKVAWRQVLDAKPKNAQYYGVAPFFTVELDNGLIEARNWSDGKRVWSHRLFAPGNNSSYYGFLADSTYIILKGYQEAHVLFPDGRTKVVHHFPYKVQSLFLHQFRVGMYCFLANNQLGYFNLETGRMEWLAELGLSPTMPARMYNETLIFRLSDRLVAFDADGRVVWSARLPISPYRDLSNFYTLIRLPGGNLAYISQNGVFWVYPPARVPSTPVP